MPRNISFSMTTPQFLDGTKDVTRRLGWEKLKAGDVLRAVEKCMGLKKGEKMKPLGMIRVVSARQELLDEMTRDADYGLAECRREGFPKMAPSEFVEFFCRGHTGAFPKRTITRIEFVKIDVPRNTIPAMMFAFRISTAKPHFGDTAVEALASLDVQEAGTLPGDSQMQAPTENTGK